MRMLLCMRVLVNGEKADPGKDHQKVHAVPSLMIFYCDIYLNYVEPLQCRLEISDSGIILEMK